MRVTDVETFPVAYPEPNDAGATRHLLLVRLTGDDGQTGWGEAVTMWPEASLATAAVVDGLRPLVLGRDPLEHEAVWQEIRDHTWWYGGAGIASFALAALDIALWDLAGKATGLPLLELLGGPSRTTLPAVVSCHASHADLGRLTEEMAGWVRDTGAWGIKVGFGKRGDANLGFDHDRDTEFVRRLRAALGTGPRIMIDLGVRNRWTVAEAVARVRAFEPYGVHWVEEPLGADDPDGYAELRASIANAGAATLVGYGEREWNVRGIQRILQTGTVDVVGIDPGRCEGVTGFARAAHLVRAAGRQANAHAWSSGIVTAASLALSLAFDCCHQLEFKPLPNPMQHELVKPVILPSGGQFHPLPGAGLGVEVDAETVRRYLLPT